MAVGYAINGGDERPLGLRWNGAWSLAAPSEPADALESELYGVDCQTNTSCVAVGRYRNSSGWRAWATTWNGTSWTAQSVPYTAGWNQSVLLDVSCSDANSCTAVGGYRAADNVQRSFVMRWNGSSWTQQTSPNPTGSTNTVLQNISCADRGWCVAVGDWLSSGVWQPMAQNWNGSSWSLDTTPNPSGSSETILEGVACRASCLAIGWYTNSSGIDTTLGQSRPAPSWTQRTLPSPLSNETLSGIDCWVANGCFAVGTGANVARIYSGGTGTWIQYDTPEPATAVYSQLRGVECSGSSWCAAVGVYNASGGSEMPYAAAEDFAPSGWVVHSVPTPSGAPAALNDVYCNLSNACMAVGDYKNAGVPKTFASFWNGSTWSTRTPLNASGSTNNVLKGVSCPLSSLDCVVVGYALVGGSYQPLVQRWNGSSWTIHTSPLPSGVSEGKLEDVSCTITNPTTCMAVGKAGSHTYALRWDGSSSSWTVLPSPRPVFAAVSHFEEVSCTSTTACTAVGDYQTPVGTSKTFAADWDGTGWTLHDTPNPHTSGNKFTGVSCSNSTTCRAAGYGSSSGATLNLVATLN